MRSTAFLSLIFFLLFSPLLIAEEGEEKVEEEIKAALYYEFKPPFIANLSKGGRYVRCDIQLMTRDEETLEMITLHAAALRHHILLLLAEQDGKTLKSAKGKESLRKKSLTTANKALAEIAKEAKIDALFFTSFFVQ